MIAIIDALREKQKLETVLNRNQFEFDAVNSRVTQIIGRVKKEGDQALLDLTKQFDGVKNPVLTVEKQALEAALKRLDPKLRNALMRAADNIKAFHEKQKPNDFVIEKPGITIQERTIAIDSVGLYIPGGSAAYPSSVLMNAIPANVAGVKRIVMVSPPMPDGTLKDSVLAAAAIAGVDAVYMVGGAQAVAALAYGTKTIPRVDKIVGPGNIYVTMAKRTLSGLVGIDTIAGPSEVAIVADENANPDFIALDMMSQAEHDVYASALVLVDSKTMAEKIKTAIIKHIDTQPRQAIIKESLSTYGAIIITKDTAMSIDLVNQIAPEHCEIHTANPRDVAKKIRHAGAIFIGPYTPESIGDYYAGPNHTLPTSGVARFASALSTQDFMKSSALVSYSKSALKSAKDDVIIIAEDETLQAHADAVKIRFEEEDV